MKTRSFRHTTTVCAYTMAGFHLACAAGIAQFDYMRQGEFRKILRENNAAMRSLITALEQRRRQGLRLKIYGTGMSYGIHILDAETGAPDPRTAAKIACCCYEKGLLLLVMSGNVLRLQPPLTIGAGHLRDGFSRLESAIDAVLAGYVPDPILLSQPAWAPVPSRS